MMIDYCLIVGVNSLIFIVCNIDCYLAFIFVVFISSILLSFASAPIKSILYSTNYVYFIIIVKLIIFLFYFLIYLIRFLFITLRLLLYSILSLYCFLLYFLRFILFSYILFDYLIFSLFFLTQILFLRIIFSHFLILLFIHSSFMFIHSFFITHIYTLLIPILIQIFPFYIYQSTLFTFSLKFHLSIYHFLFRTHLLHFSC